MHSYKNKKVLIFGLGLNQGGVGSAKFFAKQGAEVKVTDLKNADILKPSLDELKSFLNVSYTLGEHKYEDFDWAELIIKNPAIKPGNQYIEYALKQGKQVEQDMGIFLEFIKPSQIIGVTGTKGKSTISSLIYEVLKSLRKNVILAGNIGTSVLDTMPQITPDTLVVLEISSFQLEAFDEKKVSPKWAVITNIYPDHLNYYKNMDEYIAVKRIIGLYQTKDDFLFMNKDDLTLNNSEFTTGLLAKIIFYTKNDLPKNFKPMLAGEHNLSNYAAALAVVQEFPIVKDEALKTMQKFKGIEFRLQFIKNWKGIKIINDTTSTGPDAGIKALQTFPNCILIAGGMNKNMPYEEYAKALERGVKKVFFLVGDSTDEIKKLIKNKDLIASTYDNLEKLLTDVKKEAKPGDIILLSPAATSFNLFQNEFDRGRKFNKAVEKIFK